jgi:hypothetical protein
MSLETTNKWKLKNARTGERTYYFVIIKAAVLIY